MALPSEFGFDVFHHKLVAEFIRFVLYGVAKVFTKELGFRDLQDVGQEVLGFAINVGREQHFLSAKAHLLS